MKRRLAALLFAMVMAAAVSAGAGEKQYTIGMLNPYIGNTWRAQYLEMAEEGARIWKEKGRLAEFTIATSNNDVSQQLNQMNNMINQKVDAILLDPTSTTALAVGIQRALDEGILVLVSQSPSAYENTYNYTHDNRAFPTVNASWLVEALGGKGNIVEITGLVGNPSDTIRIEIHEQILSKTDIKVLGIAPANWSHTEAQTVMSQFLSTYDNIDGVLQQDVTALGVLRAYDLAGRKVPAMVGDTTFGYLREWQKRRLNSIGYPMHPGIIVDCLGMAIKLLDGKKINPEYLQANLFDEEMVNAIYAEPPFIVSNTAMPNAAWMQGKRFTKSLGVDEAVVLGEGKSAETMLDGYLTEEQLDTYFLP